MPWDPLHELVGLPGRLADRNGAGWTPHVDLYETDDRYVLIAEMPGLGAGDFRPALRRLVAWSGHFQR